MPLLALPADAAAAPAAAGSWSLDLRTLHLTWSDAVARIHGLPPGSNPGLQKSLDAIDEADRSHLVSAVLQSLDGRGVFDVEVRITTAQGGRKLVRVSGHVEVDSQGRAILLHGHTEDLWGGPPPSFDQAVRLAGQVMAHELKSRMGVISGFAAEIDRSEAGVLSERGAHWLARVRRAAGQADRIVDALGLLADASPVQRESVDLSALCREVLAHLAERDPQRQVEATVQKGIVLAADPQLLFLLLQNLLGNAWKFTAARPDARIRVETDRTGDGLVVRVADNGIGFEPRDAARIFELFTRLQGPQAYEGCGVGLALAWRVVERHGGAIWAEGAPGQGATFSFRL